MTDLDPYLLHVERSCGPPAQVLVTSPWLACSVKRPLKAATGDSVAMKPLSPKPPHFNAKAKRIIFLFMEGAMSESGHLRVQARIAERTVASPDPAAAS